MEEEKKDKTGAIIKLSLWLVFILAMVCMVKLTGKREVASEKEEPIPLTSVSYEEKLDKLNDNFAYDYNITIGDVIYNYKGKKLVDSEVGVYTVDTNSVNYYLNKGYIYSVVDGGLTQIDNLYTGINKNYIDVTYLKELIKDREYIQKDNTYEYVIDNLTIDITVNDTDIISIILKEENNSYSLNYSEIGNILEISY